MTVSISNNRGFTLTEAMITVAILAILAAIAYPMYTEQVARSRRGDAQSALLGLANAMERHFTNNTSYIGARGAGNAPTIYPAQAPIDGPTKYYNLLISAVTATTYTLQAQPIHTQAGDKCGTYVLDSNGTRTINSAATGITAADCWR